MKRSIMIIMTIAVMFLVCTAFAAAPSFGNNDPVAIVAQTSSKAGDEASSRNQKNGKSKNAPAAQHGQKGQKSHNWIVIIIGSLAGGGLVAFITRRVLCASMSNVAPALSAKAYLKKGTFRLNDSQDIFLYTKVDVSRKQTANRTDDDGGA